MEATIFIIYFTILCLLLILILTAYYVLSTNNVLKKWEVKPYNSTMIEGFGSNEGLTGNQAYPANTVKIWEGNTQETITCNYDFTATILAVAPGGNGHSGCGNNKDGGAGGGGGGAGGAWYYDTNFQFKKGIQYTFKITSENVSITSTSGDNVTINKGGNGYNCNNGGVGGTFNTTGDFKSTNAYKGKNGGGGGSNRGRNSYTNYGSIYTINDYKVIVGGGGGGAGTYSAAYSGDYDDSKLGDIGAVPGVKSNTGYAKDIQSYCYGNGGGGGQGDRATPGGAGGGGAVIIYYTTTAPTTPAPTTTSAMSTPAPTTTAPVPVKTAPLIYSNSAPLIWYDFTDVTNKGISGNENDALPVSPSGKCICTTSDDINLPVLQIPNDGYLSIGNTFAIRPIMFSMSFWYNVNWDCYGSSSNSIFTLEDTVNSRFIRMGIEYSGFKLSTNNFNAGYPMLFNNGGQTDIYGLMPPDITSTTQRLTTQKNAGTWQHVVITMDKNVVNYYLNGKLTTSSPNTETAPYMNINNTMIFNQPILPTVAKDGQHSGQPATPNNSGYSYLADFRIYNYVLQSGDVIKLYCPNPDNLTVYSPTLTLPAMPPKSVTTPVVQYNFEFMNQEQGTIPNQGFGGTANDGEFINCYAKDRAIVIPDGSYKWYGMTRENASRFAVSGSITARDITVAYWYKTNTPLDYYNLDPILSLKNYTNGMIINSQDARPYISMVDGFYARNVIRGTGAMENTDNKWVHVILTTTFDSINQLFINGNDVSNYFDNPGRFPGFQVPGYSITLTPILPLIENHLTLPFDNRDRNPEQAPQVADFRIYSYALSASEAVNLYKATTPTTPTTPAPTTPKPTTPAPSPTQFALPYSQIIDVLSSPEL